MYRIYIKSALAGMLLLMVSLECPAAECTLCHSQLEAHHSTQAACTDCHGDSTTHAAAPSNGPDRIGEKTTTACLGCHDGRNLAHWVDSEHGLSEVPCASCHVVHDQHRKPAEASCVDCHKPVFAAQRLPSRHPIREGEMACTDCHNPHKSEDTSLLTDGCLNCHQEMRGPFLFEHDPVTEDCAICHQPHGSANPSLLTARPPFLCQQCHMASDHAGEMLAGKQLQSKNASLVGRSCVNCHSKVHGTNHPSGARLTR